MSHQGIDDLFSLNFEDKLSLQDYLQKYAIKDFNMCSPQFRMSHVWNKMISSHPEATSVYRTINDIKVSISNEYYLGIAFLHIFISNILNDFILF